MSRITFAILAIMIGLFASGVVVSAGYGENEANSPLDKSGLDKFYETFSSNNSIIDKTPLYEFFNSFQAEPLDKTPLYEFYKKVGFE